MNITAKNLVDAAITAREKSYCPYSNFSVGAALLTKEGKVYTGANIESVSFTPTICAERVAFFSAVHNGEKNFKAIAIVGAKKGEEINAFCSPCGVCRQVMQEFCEEDFEIYLYDGKDIKAFSLIEIFPEAFNNNIL